MLKINPEAISESVKPAINNAISDLKEAQSAINSMQMPSDFTYGSKIKGLSSEISGVISQIKGIDTDVTAEINEAIAIEMENASLVNSLLGGLQGIGNTAKKLGASAANTILGFGKGVANVGEALVDATALLATGVNTIITAPADGISFIISKVTGNDDEWKSMTAEMWKNTAGFVAKDYVNDVYETFYNKSSIGQWLDKNAYDAFKSNGIATNAISGIGEVVGIAAVTIGTMGVGGAALGLSAAGAGAVTAGVVGAGKAAEEYWGNKVSNSWKGIENEYKKGNISKEQYNNLKDIRENITEEDINELLKNGQITEEEAQTYRNIINMPEDGITNEDIAKGLAYAVGTGVWEGAQWYIGGSLLGMGGKSLSSSAIKVAIDANFNALDTPYRTILEAATTDKTLKEAWEDQGGWESVITNTAIGIAGAAGGEILDKMGDFKLKVSLVSDIGSDKEIKDIAGRILNNQYSKGYINLDDLSIDKVRNYVNMYKGVAKEEVQYQKYFKDNELRFKNFMGTDITNEDISMSFDKTTVFQTKDEFVEFLENVGYTHEEAIRLNGVNNRITGETFLYADKIDSGTITHEVNHSLGSVSNNMNEYIAINEAFTQSIARKINPTAEIDGYEEIGIVDTLNKITNGLEDYGYKNVDLISYFEKNPNYYKEKVDNIAGDGFYEALAKSMQFTLKGFDSGDWKKVEIGQGAMESLVKDFERSLKKINK